MGAEPGAKPHVTRPLRRAEDRGAVHFWRHIAPWIAMLVQLGGIIFVLGMMWQEVRQNTVELERFENEFLQYVTRQGGK